MWAIVFMFTVKIKFTSILFYSIKWELELQIQMATLDNSCGFRVKDFHTIEKWWFTVQEDISMIFSYHMNLQETRNDM